MAEAITETSWAVTIPGICKTVLIMTIYLVKWTNHETKESNRAAFSSMTEARKKVNQLTKDNQVGIHSTDEFGPIQVLKPKTQADVINLINTL